MKYLNKSISAKALVSALLTGALFLPSMANAFFNKTQESTTLKITASSELKDLESLVKAANPNLNLQFTYTGTLDALDTLDSVSGSSADVLWLARSSYLGAYPKAAKKVILSDKTMTSPLVLAVKPQTYDKYFSSHTKLTWADVAKIVSQNSIGYAMSDPASSNSGYSALLALAYSASAKAESITYKDVNQEVLKKFFKNLRLSAASSGDLAQDFFSASNTSADILINYESVILSHNRKNPASALKIIYPHEGIITADYPIMLVNPKQKEAFYALRDNLRSQDTQNKITQSTLRRPLNNAVRRETSSLFPKQLLIEVPFDFNAELSEELLSGYYNTLKTPASFAFVLDTSGSMKGARWSALQNTMQEILKPSAASFSSIRNREQFFLIPFSSQVYAIQFFDAANNKQLAGQSALDIMTQLSPTGGTALYSAAAEALKSLSEQRKRNVAQGKVDYRYSVILLTDGEANEGIDSSTFLEFAKNPNYASIPVHTIKFGDASVSQIQTISGATGGKVFDASTQSLNYVFKQIRAQQ